MSTHRNKRFDRTPVVGKDGAPISAIITPRREELLRFLFRNRYATQHDLHAYLGGDSDALYYSLRVMRAENNRLIKKSEQTLRDKNLTRRDVYELDTQGIAYLSRKGEAVHGYRSTRNFNHARLAAHITASIETGIQMAGNATLVPWARLLESESVPQETREKKLAGIPTSYVNPDGEVVEKIVFPDSKPFAIALETGEGRRVRFLPGVEADTGSEPVTTADFLRTSIYAKFLAYLSIEQEKAYKSHYGFPNFYVPFVTTDPTRLGTMLDTLERMGGSKTMIFGLADEDAEPGYLFRQDWRRAGHGPVNLSK